jgi:excisionase family DNA binding protein
MKRSRRPSSVYADVPAGDRLGRGEVWYTPREAARLLGVPAWEVARLLREGQLRSLAFSATTVRILSSSLKRLLKHRAAGEPGKG